MNILGSTAVAAVAVGAALGLCATAAPAAEVYAVCHPSVALSADELREVFLGDKQFAGGVKLAPLDNAALQAEFQARVLKLDATRYASIWTKKGFREGLVAPALRGSDAEVLGAVRASPAAVGYVSRPSADVRVIQKF